MIWEVKDGRQGGSLHCPLLIILRDGGSGRHRYGPKNGRCYTCDCAIWAHRFAPVWAWHCPSCPTHRLVTSDHTRPNDSISLPRLCDPRIDSAYNERRTGSYSLKLTQKDSDKVLLTAEYPYLMSAKRDPQTSPNLRLLYKQQAGRCYICTGKFEEPEMTEDHVVPASRGGRAINWNIALACQPCNQEKADRTMQEYLRQAGMAAYAVCPRCGKKNDVCSDRLGCEHQYPVLFPVTEGRKLLRR